jgi:membrane-bound ClpP family serine protease
VIEWVTVISLIVFGLALVVAEIIFVPGTTVVGIIGFIFLIAGVAFAFNYFGSETGWIMVGATAVISGLVFYFSFKTNVWGKFSLKSSIDSKVNEGILNSLTVGLEGKTTSALRPIGKALLGEKEYEVRTAGDYLDSGSAVRIVRINSNQIIVEHINS